MQGTRLQVLSDILAWILDPDSKPSFWLSGMAGVGKTSIAWTVCDMVQAETGAMLGGSFFCSRAAGSVARRDVNCIIPTLALMLARQSDAFGTALTAELDGYKVT